MAFPMIYLAGWPGVGKHTICKETVKKIGDNARIVSLLKYIH